MAESTSPNSSWRAGGFAVCGLLTAGWLFSAAHAQVPQLINYQGRVSVNGTNFTGTGQFKFALVNATGATTFWSNGVATAAVTVSNGLYAVLLGDTGMNAIPATVFTNSDVRLRVWFNDGIAGLQQLAPDQRIAAVGYAMIAANVADGVVTSNKLAAGAVNTAALAANAVTSAKIADGAVAFADIGQNAATDGQVIKWSTAGSTWTAATDATGGTALAGYDEQGTFIPAPDATGLGAIAQGRRAQAIGSYSVVGGGSDNTASNSYTTVSGGQSNTVAGLWGAIAGGLNNFAGGNGAMVPGGAFNDATGIASFAAGYRAKALHTGAFVWGDYNASEDFSSATNNQFALRASGGMYFRGPDIWLWNPAGGTYGQTAKIKFGDSDRIYLQEDEDDKFRIHAIGRIALDGLRVGIGTLTPAEKLDVSGGDMLVRGADNFAGAGSVATVFLGDSVHYLRATREFGLTLGTWPVGDVICVREPYGWVGIGTNAPQATLHVAGTTRTSVLEITGGSDLAEPFETSDPEPAPKGAVLVIDGRNPGQLRLSDEAYDKRVAGVVSGAGGLNAGLTLSQAGLTDKGAPVALSGRVYALADASNGPIQPGDQLTTSGIPGHAMKVTDSQKAQGAVLGKAMSALDSGRGLVLVLVTLQ